MSSRVKGTYSAHSEKLAVAPDGPLKFRRKDCDVCKKETIHRGLKCTGCGVMSKLLTPGGLVARMGQRESLSFYSARSTTRRLLVKNDRQEYLAKKAAESRAKFEGASAPIDREVTPDVCQTDIRPTLKVG